MVADAIVWRESPHKVTVELRGVSDAFANQLRWALSRELPTVAAERVRIHENSTPFPDEYIAHRIGMIPFAPRDGESAIGDIGHLHIMARLVWL